MVVRYSKQAQQGYLEQVKKLLSEGHTLNSACSSVSARGSGLPVTNTLATWARKANLNASAAPAAALSDTPDVISKNLPAPENEPTPVSADDHVRSSVDDAEYLTEPFAEQLREAASAVETSAFDTPGDTGRGQAGVAELVHVPSDSYEAAVDENRRLRRALNEANREVRAMRDLLVVYASR